MMKKVAVPAPQNLKEAAQYMEDIGQAQRAIIEINTDLDTVIEALKAEAREKIDPLQKKISLWGEGLWSFSEANRDKLTHGGKRKRINLAAGDFGWRMSKWSVIIKDIKVVRQQLMEVKKLKKFLRPKDPDIDKQQLLKYRKKIAGMIKGIVFFQQEVFYIRPAKTNVEVHQNSQRLKYNP